MVKFSSGTSGLGLAITIQMKVEYSMNLTRNDWIRLILASAVCPSIPMFILSLMSFGKIVPLVFIVGYFCFFIFGLPALAMVLRKKLFWKTVLAGGIVSMLPVFILNALSLFATTGLFNLQSLIGYGSLFLSGALGGGLFWLIAFSKISFGRGNPNPQDLV